jgi:hypothetical protein
MELFRFRPCFPEAKKLPLSIVFPKNLAIEPRAYLSAGSAGKNLTKTGKIPELIEQIRWRGSLV